MRFASSSWCEEGEVLSMDHSSYRVSSIWYLPHFLRSLSLVLFVNCDRLSQQFCSFLGRMPFFQDLRESILFLLHFSLLLMHFIIFWSENILVGRYFLPSVLERFLRPWHHFATFIRQFVSNRNDLSRQRSTRKKFVKKIFAFSQILHILRRHFWEILVYKMSSGCIESLPGGGLFPLLVL